MRKSNGFSAAILFSSLATVGSAFYGSDALAQDVAASALDEIIVTAQKREQALADIPMSISVLSGDLLQRQQADNIEDLVMLVPGLSIDTGQRGVTRITLRGTNTGGIASTVGTYVGDVPFGSSSGLANAAILSGDFDTYDLARVEVLRGPQGTLYGASALGGVMKYVPNQPNTEAFEGSVQAAAEEVKDADTGFAFNGMLNIPISDQFALRATAYSRTDEGYIDSIGNNPLPSFPAPVINVVEGTRVEEGLNWTETVGGRVIALFAPSERFSVNLMALMQDIDSGGPNLVDADAVTLQPQYSSPVQSRYQEAYSDIEYRLYSATLDWSFGGVTLQSVTGDGSFEQNLQQDAALATALLGGLTSLAAYLTFVFDDPNTPEIAPLLSAVLPQITSTDKLTQEFRLLSADNDTFEWLLGAYYADEESLINQVIYAVDSGTENLAAGFPALAVADLQSTYEELAVFANATWYISPRFELSFGARASDNDQTIRQITSGPLAGDTDVSGKSSESPVTWSVSPRWELNDSSSIYARVATGFRPGGPNAVPPTAPPDFPTSYESDSLTSYEAGYKHSAADGRFSVDVTAYFLDWEDIQVTSSFSGFTANANAGTAASKGIEFATSFAPTDGLVFALNAAYTDAYLTEDAPDLGAADGDPLSYVPEWAFGLLADYEWDTKGGSEAYVGGSFAYVGDRPADLGNRDANNNIRNVDNYTTLNLRAGLRRENWFVELYGKNVTDKAGINTISSADEGYTGRVGLGYIRPRTYGVMAGVNF
ncbi:MAG: TonB-dependent receptor [Gammaproteobacteria bacterium]|nr:TonB-dependent receptor [Gammaproteobacteria bacterium]